MSGVAVGVGAATLVGGYMSSQASGRAIDAQSAAAGDANRTQKEIYDMQRDDARPYMTAGQDALTQLQNPNIMQNFTGDPGYQFRLDQGGKAINAAAAARGMGNSGATMKALQDYAQNMASNEYSNAYNRNYSRLSQLAGYGQAAAAGQAASAQNYGNQVSSNQIGLGNAIGASNIAQSNNMSNMISNGMMVAAPSIASWTSKLINK